MMEAALVGQQGHVYAIEPAPHNHELLQYNIRLNNIDNMTVLPPCAIGNVDAIGKLYLGDSANWHTLSKPSHNASSYMEIPVRKLDSLLGEISVQSVDFIRMDIEGYEVEAIKGMWSTLERSRPRLMIELHYDTAGVKGINELLGSLMSLNYQVEYILDRDLDLPSVEHKEVIKNIPINILMTGAPSYRVAMCFLVAKGER
jgi:FkbM family methyltransferase